MSAPKPVALIIMDGFGLRNTAEGNAVAQANKPNYDRYLKQYPNTTLTACGEAVGLPEGQMGNSEVGHLNIGAGRIVYQDLTRIDKSILSLTLEPPMMAVKGRSGFERALPSTDNSFSISRPDTAGRR